MWSMISSLLSQLIETQLPGTGAWLSVLLLPACMAASFLVLALLAVAIKWALLGRQREGTHPVWGGMYLRW